MAQKYITILNIQYVIEQSNQVSQFKDETPFNFYAVPKAIKTASKLGVSFGSPTSMLRIF